MPVIWLDFDPNGQSARLVPLMRELNARVVCPRASLLAHALREQGHEGHMTTFRGGYGSFLWLLPLRRLLAHKPDTVKPDTVLLAHGDQAALATAWVRRVAAQTPLVVFFSDSTARPAVQWSRAVIRTLSRVDQVCVVTRELADSLTECLSATASKSVTTPVPVRVVPPLAPETGLLPENDDESGPYEDGKRRRTVFLCADDLVPESGFHDLMDAMGLMQGLEGLPPWEVRVLGAGEDFDVLLDKARSLKTEAPLALLGPQALDVQLPLAQVAVSTSRSSRNRMDFIFRTWACGRTLVSSATPEAQELVVDKLNGLVYPPGNAVALAALLARCLSEPEMLQQIAVAGRASLAGYSVEMVADSLRLVCQDACKR